MSNANATNGSGSDMELQKRKFNMMKLKEEWEVAEKRLKRRKNLILLNIVASLIALLLGAMLVYIEVERLANTTFRIITSSVAGTGAILSLLNVIYERLRSNEDSIKELIKATKIIDSDQKFVPLLIGIPDELLTEKLDKDCQKYLKFLERINELIKEEKKINATFIVLTSFYIIITSVISILINVDIIPHNSKYDDLILAISIIVIGWKWFTITILSKFERTFEKWVNYSLKPQGGLCGAFYFCLITVFVAPIAQVIFIVILKPSRIYYCLSKRLYLVNRYDSDDSNRNIDLEKVDIERVTFFEDQKIKIDQIDQRIRFFGTKEERKKVYSKGLTEVKIVSDKSKSTLEGSESNNESPEVSENKPEIKVSENKKLIINDKPGLIEKYIIPTFILIKVETEYQILIESIEITKTQKEELRSILCGISATA
ncbi:14254_t:CDS:2 [Gigaspora rosea]|nr:14254_t:CDS:2 [Gigaspora rosea]